MSRSRRILSSSLEPLEARIAPALLIVGANLLGAPGGPSTGSTSIGGYSVTVAQVLAGEAIVWWDGSNIDAISYGPNCKLDITGNVLGDIVGNLTASGQLSNSMKTPLNGLDGDVLLANNLLGLTTHPLGSEKGDVNHIITGGSVSNVNVAGELNGIYAGDGVFFPGNGSTLPASELFSGGVATSNVDTPPPSTPAPYSINPLQPGGEYSFNFTLATSKTNLANNVVGLEPSASIQNITMATAGRMQVFAGSGNPNDLTLKTAVPGGSINNVSLQTGVLIRNNSGYLPPDAVYSYYLLAGDGSSGPVGGAGGSITNITEVSSAGEAILQAGQGGVGSHGAGGAGGSVVNLNLQSDSTQYVVNAGNGGVGTPGGPGGKLTDNNFANRTQTGGILVPGNFTGAAFPNGTGSGADDLMVIDQGTGNMILEENVGGTGTDFVPVVQYVATPTLSSPGGPVTTIPSEGTTPIAAAAVYLEGPNSPLDLVVAYQGGSLVAFFNQGGGVFYSKTLNATPGFTFSTTGLGFTPTGMAALDPDGNAFVISSNVAGTSATSTMSATGATSDLHLVTPVPAASSTSLPGFIVDGGSNVINSTITALKGTGDDTFFTGTSQGAIGYFTIGSLLNAIPFNQSSTVSGQITGGISQLALDSSGHILLATSNQASMISAFDFNLSNLTPLSLIGTVSGFQGKPIEAHFIESVPGETASQSGQPDSIAVLSQFKSDSAITQLLPQASTNGTSIPPGYTVSQTINFNETVNEFVPDYPNSSFSSVVSLADLTNAVNKFEVSTGFGMPVDYALPFASKSVIAGAGNGGNGVDYTGAHGLVVGAGGAGGSIYGFNAQAHVIELTTGAGGDTQTGAGGVGGSIGDPTEFTSGGAAVTPSLISDDILQINVGDGGSPTDPGPKASGGNGGSIDSLAITLNSGNMTLTAGTGGDSMGGNAGNGGSITGLMATDGDGNITASGGDGGSALDATGVGGAGGSIVGLHYQLSLLQSVAVLEKPYSATLTAGSGGSSIGGAGGAGGSITGANLNINPSFRSDMTSIDAGVDNTAQSILTAGHGGDGATGGAGGSIQALTFFAYDDQVAVGNNTVVIDPVTLSLAAGYGGKGTHGNGGNGGSVNLATPIEGVSFYDNAPTTTVAETTPGVMGVSPEVQTITFGAIQYPYELSFKIPDGHGGFITDTTPYFYDVSDANAASLVQTALDNLPTINEATGGAGVTVTSTSNSTLVVTFNNDGPENLLIATPLPNQPSFTENPLVVVAGHGGDGSVKGGVGGGITGVVSENAPFFDGSHIAYEELFGASLTAGNGGNGGTSNGGAGGSITGSSIGFEGAMLNLTAGHGGNGGTATGALPTATGGAGGSIASSVFGLVGTEDAVGMDIVAGAGGSGIAAGGVGGSVLGMTINTSEGTAVPSALIYAGDGGGAASASGAGGHGGSISGISQTKDINSSIDVLQAGNGGDNTIGHGGVGGNVTNIHSVGFIGRPTNGSSALGVFDTIDYTVNYTIDAVTIAQGIFSGDGGTGGTSALDAANGYVENVVARQIAAISAADNPSTQLFAAASKISGITAEVIGFDVNRATDNGNPVYVGGGTPGTVVPTDGFMWSLTAATNMHVEFPEPTFIFVGE